MPLLNMNFNTQCKSCPTSVHCCIFKNNKGFTFVGIGDAKRIRKFTKKEYSNFLDFSPLPKKVVNSLKHDDPSLEGALRFSQLNKKNQLLRLKTKKNGYCIFLNNKRRCEIYKIRPNICKIFPFWAMKLLNGKTISIEHDVEPKCKSIKSIKKPDVQIENLLSKKEKSNIIKIFKGIQKESKSYKNQIKEFSKNLN